MTELHFTPNGNGTSLCNETLKPDTDGNIAVQVDFGDTIQHQVHFLVSVDYTHWVNLNKVIINGGGLVHVTGLLQGEAIKISINSNEKCIAYAHS